MCTDTLMSTSFTSTEPTHPQQGTLEPAMRDDRMVAYVSHELRNPLATLKTRLFLARRHPENFDQHLRIMEEVTDQMKCLVDDLLDSARLQHGTFPLAPRPVDLRELINHAIEQQGPAAVLKLIKLSADCPNEPVMLCVDPNRITQVLTNLIANAINYTPVSGEVVVQLFALPGEVRLCVCDNGLGISADALHRIFEPFFRGDNHGVSGTGLGLAIAKAIVEQHGGAISVASKLGRGSVFTVALPKETPYADMGSRS
jgi:signal transduction histidine kinase